MSPKILLISNTRHRMSYTAGLYGYGYDVQESSTFEGARVLLHTGTLPQTIIIDVKFHQREVEDFIYYLRVDMGLRDSRIIVINNTVDDQVIGANAFFYRPAELNELVQIL